MANPKLCIAILAAGSSQRFGPEDKLAQDLGGQMLGLHMAERLTGLDAAHRIVVTSSCNHPYAENLSRLGYAIIDNPDAESGMGSSVAHAANYALQTQADALLIALADMPFVPLAHCNGLVSAMKAGTDIVATSDGDHSVPPAIFHSSVFEQLTKLDGDTGARDLIANAPSIKLAPELTLDVDTPEDLALANLSLT
ncbi:MAG: nucleotidyltransferase family protein [Erythrobacter sp.]